MSTIPFIVRAFQLEDEADVIVLWARCNLIRSWNDPRKDIQRKLRVQPDLFLVGMVGERIVATVMAGYEGHRGWINYLAVGPEAQGQGYGRQMMEAAELRLRAIGCAKLNLLVRTSNQGVLDFYERLGYQRDEVFCLGKRLEFDE